MKKILVVLAICMFPAMAGAADLGGSMKDGPIVSFPSQSGEAHWSGIYIGGQIGYENSNHKLNADATFNQIGSADAFIDGLNSQGAFGGVTIGADWQRGHWVFGAFGDFNFTNADTTAGISIDGRRLMNAKIEEGNSWLIAGRIGYLVSERALLYGLIGYERKDMDYSASIGSDAWAKSATFSGLVIGAGGEYALTQNVFFGLEYQHFFGSTETSAVDDPDGTKVTDTVDSDQVMAKLKFKFNAWK